MSNKLKKTSPAYNEVKKTLREKIEKEGGLNVEPKLMKQFTECEDETKSITQDEFFDILAQLSDEGFKLFKISQICKGKEERGLMICNEDTIIAFTKDPNKTENKPDEGKE